MPPRSRILVSGIFMKLTTATFSGSLSFPRGNGGGVLEPFRMLNFDFELRARRPELSVRVVSLACGPELERSV